MKLNTSFIAGLIALMAVAACQETTPSNDTPVATVVTAEDSLYKSIMALHDEAMPKMGALIGMQKKAQEQIDSLKALKNPSLLPVIQQLDQLKIRLANAEKGMNDWMEQFEPDPSMPTTEERASYFEVQKAKAQAMRNEIFTVLDSAAAIIQ